MTVGLMGLIWILFFGFWIWALVDAITTDSEECRNLPKIAWIILVVVVPYVGAILWFLVGRPKRKYRVPTSGNGRTVPRRPVGIEDRPDFGSAVTDRQSAELDRRLAEWESRAKHPSESDEGERDLDLDQ